MQNANQERQIKRQLYGTPQSVELIFPPGFADVAEQEIISIFNTPWFEQKYVPQITRLPQVLRVDNIHLFSVMELLMRSLCLSDIRLILLETKVVGNFSFEQKCNAVSWSHFLSQDMAVKLRVRSVASRAFHESGLKERLADILSAYAGIVSSDDETAATVFADLNNNRLTLSLSLAGAPLYKRGYRGTLSQSAPLREDAAACCLQKAMIFAATCHPEDVPDEYLIPFSGTGTFLLETLLSAWCVAPCLLGRHYAIQKMPFFREKHFAFLLKKAKEQVQLQRPLRFSTVDTSAMAIEAMHDNVSRLQQILAKNDVVWHEHMFHWQSQQADFLQYDVNEGKHLFLPLNPPYGLRMRKQHDSVVFYKSIALKINALSQHAKSLAGFILCPTEATWSVFSKTLLSVNKQTYHFTQGGIDVRVCQFMKSGA